MAERGPTNDRGRYFDPQVIARLAGLEVRARRVIEGVMLGLHRSPCRGVSLEFAQHRMYAPGDDLRHLDWKVYARSDRFTVKQYEQETNLTCHVLLDRSESMAYRGGAPWSKFECAATLVASLAYLLVGQRDAVALTLFDSAARTTTPARTTGGHFRQLVVTLEGAAAASCCSTPRRTPVGASWPSPTSSPSSSRNSFAGWWATPMRP